MDRELLAEVTRVELVLSHPTGELDVPAPPTRSPLVRAAERFSLDAFERWALTLALAAELSPAVALRLARRDDNYGLAWPTVGLALVTARARSHHAFDDDAPLRAWGLVELEGAGPLPSRAIRLAAGVRALLEDASTGAVLDDGRGAVGRLASGDPAIVVVRGDAGSGRETAAARVARAAGLEPVRALDSSAPVRFALRDARWRGGVAVIDAGDRATTIAKTVEQLKSRAIVIGGTASALAQHTEVPVIEIVVRRPDVRARAQLWAANIPVDERGEDLDPVALARKFRLGPAQIATAARLARASSTAEISGEAAEAAARAVSGDSLGELAQPLDADRTLDDLVLPGAARRELALAIAWARHGAAVFAEGADGEALARGPGMACLFYGPSGTGKTLGARVFANAIGLALYRVDLSQVFDKYIGETEKRLDRLFVEADRGNAILFFDEADALFARRTDVGDARDRYANVETAYLLQRIERHPGICVLATNLRDNFDPAFLRRIHVAIEFPAPRPPERAAIWRRLLPASRADDVDIEWLAQRFALTGGDINNAIASSLLVATADAREVAMRDVVFGVWRELTKSGRLVEAGQFGPWASHVTAGARTSSSRADRSSPTDT